MSKPYKHFTMNCSSLQRSTKQKLQLGERSLELLHELVQGQDYDIEELATPVLTRAIYEHHQTADENVRLWESLSVQHQQVAAFICMK